MAQLSLDQVQSKVVTQVTKCSWCGDEGLVWVTNRNNKRYLADIYVPRDGEAAPSGLKSEKSNIGEIYVLKFSAHNCEVIQFAKDNGITRTVEVDGKMETKLDLGAAKREFLADEALRDKADADPMGFIEVEEDDTLN